MSAIRFFCLFRFVFVLSMALASAAPMVRAASITQPVTFDGAAQSASYGVSVDGEFEISGAGALGGQPGVVNPQARTFSADPALVTHLSPVVSMSTASATLDEVSWELVDLSDVSLDLLVGGGFSFDTTSVEIIALFGSPNSVPLIIDGRVNALVTQADFQQTGPASVLGSQVSLPGEFHVDFLVVGSLFSGGLPLGGGLPGHEVVPATLTGNFSTLVLPGPSPRDVKLSLDLVGEIPFQIVASWELADTFAGGFVEFTGDAGVTADVNVLTTVHLETDLSAVHVPEPGSLSLMGIAALMVSVSAARRRSRRA